MKVKIETISKLLYEIDIVRDLIFEIIADNGIDTEVVQNKMDELRRKHNGRCQMDKDSNRHL